MGNSAAVQSAFSGGEWSPLARGRFDEPAYKTALAVCFNGLPIETGAWTRRPGTQYCGVTRNGAMGRVIAFDLEEDQPYNMEFTDGFIRFWDGPTLVTTSDDQSVVGISTATPAVVQTINPHGWTTGNTIYLKGLGVGVPTLQNRSLVITVVDTFRFSLVDPLTQTAVDGATLGAFLGGTVSRVQEVATPFNSGSWASLRSIQAEEQAVLLNGTTPQLLDVSIPAGNGKYAQFALQPIDFLDGPYLDPITGGVTVTPGGAEGNISLSISYQTYSSAAAYGVGDYVVASGLNYQSLIDSNVGNTPSSSPGAWNPVASDAFVTGGGFKPTDIGRAIRLFSQPALWLNTTSYTTGEFVTYNNAYWVALESSLAAVPGADVAHWGPAPQQAAWTWGRITGFANLISGTIAGGGYLGDMNQGGGVAAAFNGTTQQAFAQSAQSQVFRLGMPAGPFSISGNLGQNFTGAGAQKVASAAIFPTSDYGYIWHSGGNLWTVESVTANLYASNTSPSSETNGTLIGTATTTNVSGALSVISNSSAAWNYVWVQIVVMALSSGPVALSAAVCCAQVQFFAPAVIPSATIDVAILGPPLVNSTPISVWQLGAFSLTTGWPTCGTYIDGRIWLNDPLGNVFNASVSDAAIDMSKGISFAPTAYDGTVTDSNGIRGVFNAPDVNTILWMIPDLQGVVCGTQGGEWLIQSTQGTAITPTNVSARRMTRVKCANVEPRRAELTIVFVQAFQRKLMEYFADVFSGKYTAPNLSEMAKHLTVTGLEEIAYQQELFPVVWARVGSGALIGASYKRDSLFSSQGPKFIGWHRHTLGSGRSVQSITVGPDATGDLEALMMVTGAPAASCFVELMTNMADEAITLPTAWQLDTAVVPTSYSINGPTVPVPYGSVTFNGLWHLNGATVSVWSCGLDCGDYPVANGSLTVPFGDGIANGPGSGLFTQALLAADGQTVIGYNYLSQGQQLPPVDPRETGAQAGIAFGKVQRGQQISILLANSGPGGPLGGIKFGGSFTQLHQAQFKTGYGFGRFDLPVNQLFTGIYWNTIDDSYTLGTMSCWQVDRPYPMTLTSFGEYLHTQDR